MQIKSKCIFMSCHQNVKSELLYRIPNNSFENVENSEQWLTVKRIFTKEFKSRFNLGNGYYSPYLESNFFVLNGGLVQCNGAHMQMHFIPHQHLCLIFLFCYSWYSFLGICECTMMQIRWNFSQN